MVGSDARVCPQCGTWAPISKGMQYKRALIFWGVFALLFVLIFGTCAIMI